MLDIQVKPLVVYGLKHSPVQHQPDRHFIIFSCIVPGVVVPMQGNIYHVHEYNPEGYELRGIWEQLAVRAGDKVYRLASALQRTEGLYWLYILPSGLVAKGEQHLADNAPNIIAKMHQALTDVCGEIEFQEVPGRELWLPSMRDIELAKESGVLFPM